MDFIKLVMTLFNQMVITSEDQSASGWFSDSKDYLWRLLEKDWADLLILLNELLAKLGDRLLPLLINLQPVWQDPLWQALALILLIIIVMIISWWVLVKGQGLSVDLLKLIWATMVALLMALSKPIIYIYNWVCDKKNLKVKKPRWKLLSQIQVRRAVEALQYLTTRRDWRYQTPWYLLIGEVGSGKSTWIKTVKQGRRVQLLPREEKLKSPDSAWHFFDHAVVIDAGDGLVRGDGLVNDSLANDGLKNDELDHDELIAAKSESSTIKTDKHKGFRYLLELLHWYRPERPVDGVILMVSAKSLLTSKTPAQRQALGEQLYQQLWMLQKQTGFVIPVYLVVSQCDEISGFSSFWQAQPPQHCNEIFGWSNPYRIDTAITVRWIDEAFKQLTDNLQVAQLQVAASGREIQDIDGFMLFHKYFDELHQPLKEVASSTFARSSFQEPLPLRGIYFSGQVNEEIAFIDDLIAEKIFAETNLAWPVEKRRFSTQKTLRRFQLGSLVAGSLMLLLLMIDSTRLQLHGQESQRVLHELSGFKPDCSTQGLDTYRLLAGLTEIGERPAFLSLPASWFGSQMKQQQQLVAQQLLAPIVFVGMECRMQARAEEIRNRLQSSPEDDVHYLLLMERLNQDSQMLKAYHEQRNNFLYLAGPLAHDRQISKKLTGLLDYLYDSPTPKSIDTRVTLISGAVQVMSYKVDWDSSNSALVTRRKVLSHLKQTSTELHNKLVSFADETPLQGLREASRDSWNTPATQMIAPSPLLDDIDNLQLWLERTVKYWLSSNTVSPCGKVHQHLSELQKSLVVVGFPKVELDFINQRFSRPECYEKVRNDLRLLYEPPFGSLFVRNESGSISIAPAFTKLRQQIALLENLNFVRASYPPMSNSSEPVVLWKQEPLQEALQTLLDFQQFTLEQWTDEEPFYAPSVRTRLNHVIKRLIHQSTLRPSQLTVANKVSRINIETRLQQRVNSFKKVQGSLLRLSSLLQQLGDMNNSLVLQNLTRDFVKRQLTMLDKLVIENQLYESVLYPQWQDNNYARALYRFETDKQLNDYLTGQRQRLSYLTYNFAEPLLVYLLNTGGVDYTDKSPQRWLDTLTALNQYQRSEPGNQIIELEAFLQSGLANLNDNNCKQWLAKHSEEDNKQLDGSWFSERYFQINRQLRSHCKDHGEYLVLDRYFEIAQRFNRELAGRFPFAPVHQAGTNELNPTRLQQFFLYYQQAGNGLLAELNKLAVIEPDLIAGSWIRFIELLDKFNQFLQHTTNSDMAFWSLPLQVDFHALSEQSPGADQIIQWSLNSDEQFIGFPNNGNEMPWQVGRPMELELRWATSSAYQPLPQLDSSPSIDVNVEKRLIRFRSRGQWALFEWLALYTDIKQMTLPSKRQGDVLMTFPVPVTLQSLMPQAPKQVSVTQAKLLLRSYYMADDSIKTALELPNYLPHYAPGFSDTTFTDAAFTNTNELELSRTSQ